MRITNAKIFANGKFVNGGIEFDDKIIDIVEGAGSSDYDANGMYIIPGLIDIHSHAAIGEDASNEDADMEALGKYYAKEGVTSWCPTTMTLKEEDLQRAVKNIVSYNRPYDGARFAGINMEGPFLSASKKGAQNEANLQKPSFEMFKRLYDAAEGKISLVSVAPELDGSFDFIEKAAGYTAVSLGHTQAAYDIAMKAFSLGASHVTHLYNAMPALHHRMPGVIGAALDSNASAELIADGLHIHPSVIRLSFKLFKEKLCLISDSIACAGLSDGDYELGGLPVTKENEKAVLKGTDTIAGSTIHLMEGLRRAVSFGVSLEDAVAAATINPARVIKQDDKIGSLEKGKYADFVILDENINVKDVYISGKRIERSSKRTLP